MKITEQGPELSRGEYATPIWGGGVNTALAKDDVRSRSRLVVTQRRLVTLLNYYRTRISDDVSTYNFART